MPQKLINLLPETRVIQKRNYPFLAWFGRIGIYAVVFIYVVVICGFAFRWYQEQKLADLNERIEAKAEEVANNQEFIANFEKIQADYQVLGTAISNFSSKAEYLKLVEETIPEPVSILSLRLDKDTFDIEAYSTAYGAVNQWSTALTNSDLISSVELASLQRDLQDEISLGRVFFTFRITRN